jgi:hypothetical protein
MTNAVSVDDNDPTVSGTGDNSSNFCSIYQQIAASLANRTGKLKRELTLAMLFPKVATVERKECD